MLNRIVELVRNSTCHIENGTLFCKNYVIADLDLIEYFEEQGFLENILYEKKHGSKIDLEITLAKLNSIEFYENREAFIIKNRYSATNGTYYIYEINCFSTDQNDFFIQYNRVISLINSIEKIAKYSYLETDLKQIIIYREDKSLFLSAEYRTDDLIALNLTFKDLIQEVINVFSENNSEKSAIFTNQLIDFLTPINEHYRFKYLLSNFEDFYTKCINAFQYYLRNFTYNKLKLELDSKALEYTQKVQSIINESQTKLIAIPTAFVLVFATFDFIDLLSIKNFAALGGLIIFAVLIQLFLNNQKTALSFISEDFHSYKETHKNNAIREISLKLSMVEIELSNQKKRLLIVKVLLWFVPILLFFTWIILLLPTILIKTILINLFYSAIMIFC